MHDFQDHFENVNMLCWSLFSWKHCIIKQLLYSVLVISGIIKVSVSVISLGVRLGWWHLPRINLIIPDITKTSSNTCSLSACNPWVFIICFVCYTDLHKGGSGDVTTVISWAFDAWRTFTRCSIDTSLFSRRLWWTEAVKKHLKESFLVFSNS